MNLPVFPTDLTLDFFDWFESYTGKFRKPDKSFDFMLNLKYDHCHRVSQIARKLCLTSAWEESHVRLGEVLGLAHDAGRFRQWQKYSSCEDKATEDHGELGKSVLEEESPVANWPEPFRQLALTVVQTHNDRFLPENLEPNTRQYGGLIRDADKFDALSLFTKAVRANEIDDHPEFCWGRSRTGKVCENVLHEVEAGRLAKNTDIQSVEDFLIAMMSWVYDLNLLATMKKVAAAQFLDILAEGLPKEPRVQQAATQIKQFLNDKCLGTSLE